MHWDAKFLKDIAGEEVIDPLTILILWGGTDPLFIVLKMSQETSKQMPEAIYKILLD